ncbi:MAG: 2-hydroxy-3-oxopropionate reductase [Candidatus Meridianibacter frigidus]|nr:MAG: 2-hydroxy-3-oxopropionate reductase [Candidatus Eremiobacteraeota bacterium]
MKIAIVGTGRMGANIARRLADRGHSVGALYDHSAETARALAAELNARAFARLDLLEAADYDAVITVVTDDRAMQSIFGAEALLAKAEGALFVNCATITPQVHEDVERLAGNAGAQTLEACMAGSIPQAREGRLFLMCAGDQGAFERAKPLLADMASEARYLGAAGTAAKVKALVNMLMNINTAGLAEALALGAALDLDLATLREIFSKTGAASRVLETDGEDMQNREHEPYFSAAHAAKDSNIALALAQQAQLPLPLATATARQYDRMVSEGIGELDKSGIAELTFKGRLGRD